GLTLAAALVLGVGAGIAAGYLVFSSDDDESPTTRAESGPETGTETQSEPTGSCDLEDTSGCIPGAELVLTDEQWRCRQPLARYAQELGGALPLKVTVMFTTFIETSGPVVDLRERCTGDGTDAVDLILDIQGDGRTRGGTGDALSVKLTAHDLEITGNVDCGPREEGSHQDGIQAMGGRNITFVDLEVGDWDAERSTCTGATGGLDISSGGLAQTRPVDHRCLRCRVIACRRGFSTDGSIRARVTDSAFRSGNPAEREEELATGEVGLCDFGLSACEIHGGRDVVFERNVCDEYPYEARRR
ncbi:MAG: hypothetical protein ACRDLZ_09850, partial [Gaiellaceae bacterium]